MVCVDLNMAHAGVVNYTAVEAQRVSQDAMRDVWQHEATVFEGNSGTIFALISLEKTIQKSRREYLCV